MGWTADAEIEQLDVEPWSTARSCTPLPDQMAEILSSRSISSEICSASPARRARTMTWSLCEAHPSAPGLTPSSTTLAARQSGLPSTIRESSSCRTIRAWRRGVHERQAAGRKNERPLMAKPSIRKRVGKRNPKTRWKALHGARVRPYVTALGQLSLAWNDLQECFGAL